MLQKWGRVAHVMGHPIGGRKYRLLHVLNFCKGFPFAVNSNCRPMTMRRERLSTFTNVTNQPTSRRPITMCLSQSVSRDPDCTHSRDFQRNHMIQIMPHLMEIYLSSADTCQCHLQTSSVRETRGGSEF